MTQERDSSADAALQRALGFLTPAAEDEERVLARVKQHLLAGDVAPGPEPEDAEVRAAGGLQGSVLGKLLVVGALTGGIGFALGFVAGQRSSPEPAAAVARERAEVVAPAPSSADVVVHEPLRQPDPVEIGRAHV